MKRLHILSFLLAFAFGEIHAQYVFRHIDIADGLSDNQIRSLTQTPDGRLAVRTASILNIYNGVAFDYFYQDKRKEYKWNYHRVPKEYYDNQGRIWMKERDYLLLLDLRTNKFEYNIQSELNRIGIKNRLTNLFVDQYKNFWYVTEDKSLYLYDTNRRKMQQISSGNSVFTKKYGVPLEIAQYKNLCWIVYDSGLLRCWDYASREFVFQDDKFLNVISRSTDRLYIRPTSTGNLWLMHNNGICFYDRTVQRWKEVADINGLSNFFTCMDLDKNGNVWVGTSRSGFRIINPRTFAIQDIPGLSLENGGEITNDIHTLLVDNNNGVWIGTLFQGLYYYHPSMNKFNLTQTRPSESLISNESVRCFLEDRDGTILVGTGFGLCRFHPQTRKIEQLFPGVINDLCLSLYRDSKGRIWVGTYLKGFFCIDGKNIRQYLRSSAGLEQNPNQNVSRAIYEESNGNYWVSVDGGVGRFDPNTGKIDLLKDPRLEKFRVYYNFYRINDKEFAVVGESGIFFINSKHAKCYFPQEDSPNNPKFKDYNTKYYCMLNDSRGLEWHGTELGIRIWDNTAKKLYTLSVENGIPNNTISSILEDDERNIWVATAGGLTKIVLSETKGKYQFSFVNFDSLDRLQSGKFYDRSALKAHDGTLYFGGIHGFNYFNPMHMVYNKGANTPMFVGFSLFNSRLKEGEVYQDHIILEKPINNTRQIRLEYNENFITIEFSGLNYVNPNQTYYKYKLVNFDNNWTEVQASGLGKAVYTGLQSGKYEFIVYSANNDKVWSPVPATIEIIISPPFWLTGWALAFYAILFALTIYYTVRSLLKRHERRMQKQRALAERTQKEELDQMKFRFFTNISHEFRTPLSLIITPLETIIKKEANGELKRKLSLINNNANRLLELVNQLLDFRKLEVSGEKVLLEKGDIIQFIENIFFQFKESVSGKNLNFVFDTTVPRLIMYFDHDKMYKIMNNLLSNAIKFSTEGGYISMCANKTEINGRKHVAITIADSGCGIPEKDLNLIFDRFYQIGHSSSSLSGSGIGLHLVKEYVKLHKGEVLVASRIGEGSKFTVSLPADLMGDDQPEIEDYGGSRHEEPEKDSTRKTILIVEDNTEFRKFLAEQLSSNFNTMEASDGQTGKELAISKSPDLIVSDWMMPKMDGVELCQHLKSDIQTSHIPFILLTALNSDEDKTKGYEAGADSYISKPFSFEMLYMRILKLIEQEQIRKELFHRTIEITPSSITITSLDEKLIQKALQLVEKNMDNSEYSIDDFGRDIALSRSQLYRKLQSIVGLSPVEFIRSVRLKRAAQLLIQSQYSVSEIVDLVGFNTQKYFSKYFKDEFGLSPAQYRSQEREKSRE